MSDEANKENRSYKRRWYDSTFVRKLVDSFETVPPYKRDAVANKIIDVVESVFKNEYNRKVNTNKDMILGMYKEYEKRRWYDRNPVVLKSIKEVCSLVDQRKELQKVAVSGIMDALGQYYKREVAPVQVEIREAEPVVKDHELEEPPEEPPTKSPESKVMVSGEKLFIKRDKKPKDKPKM